MRILIIGSNGQLGYDCIDVLRAAHELRQVDVPEVDITDRACVDGLVEAFDPRVIINCAAYTNVDGAETDRAVASAVNAEGPAHLAAAALMVPRPDGAPLPRAMGMLLSAPYVNSSRRDHADPEDVFQGRGRALSPSEHLRDDLPPTLMLAGAGDALLPDARAFCQALRERSVECVIEAYAGAGHAYGLYGYPDYEAMLESIDATLTRWAEERS